MTGAEHTDQPTNVASVIDSALCTGCGACVELCPYLRTHKGETVRLFPCDREEGRCHRYCPRIATDLESLQASLFEPEVITTELGPFKGLYLTRSKDPEIRAEAQHGGTVSTLVCLALAEGIIEACVLTKQDKHLLPTSLTTRSRSEVLAAAGSSFGNAATLAEFNRVSLLREDVLGVVATPCQALALAKMRTYPAEADRQRLHRLQLVIGLFCGWTLDWRRLRELILGATGGREILSMDIPPSGYACMQVQTSEDLIEIPLEQVNQCVRACCTYCPDMTAEFADLSVGSARSRDGWEVDRHWNQVIVRSETGQQLLELARAKGVLEFKDVPPENVTKLKAVSLNKKTAARSNLSRLTEMDQNNE